MATLPRALTWARLRAGALALALCSSAGSVPAAPAGPAGPLAQVKSQKEAPPWARGPVCVFGGDPYSSFARACRDECRRGWVTGVAPGLRAPALPCSVLTPEVRVAADLENR
jgi:hypothetical protein